MIALLLGVAVASVGAAALADAAADAETCRALLERTLAAMETRPPLKEELATGLMWIRMDAEEALAAGDADGCLREARRAAALLRVE